MFLRNVLATLVGLIIFTAISVLLFIGIVSVLSTSDQKGVDIAENSVLHLKIDRPILERTVESPLTEISFGGASTGIGLKELKDAVERATVDENIAGIYLEPKFLYAGLSKLEELRSALEAFRDSGKFIVAYGEYFTESEYYLASVADELYLPEEGMLEFNGFRAEYNFLKGGLDKLGIETQVFRVGAYKSAVEPFTRTEMSEEAREQTKSLLTSIYETYISDISRTRNVEGSSLRRVADSMLATSAQDAANHKLITKTLYLDEVQDVLKSKLSLEDDDDIDFVRTNTYLKSTEALLSGKERVAVLFADGDIVNGKGDHKSIGSEALTKQLAKLRKDDKVKAIVLRVNSPGGSSLASDVIWREIELASETKPIIASMSDVAASGGYYIAMACDTIVAQPMTITGSIGIYSMYFNAQELLEEKLGITTDVVKTGAVSDVFTISRPLTDYEKQLFQKGVDDGYKTFTTKAAKDRNMTVPKLTSLAGGRVWSGIQAKENGLVDVLGGLNDAVTLAAEVAGLEADKYKVVYYPALKSPWEQLVSDLSGDYEESAMKSKLGTVYPYFMQLKQLSRHQGTQARMPFNISIQ